MPAPRAILYLRLSVAGDENSTSIERQEAELRQHATREGWEVVAVLVDDGFSGRKARAKAAEALRLIATGAADVLAVWKFDRWTRQGLAAVGDLVRALDASTGALFVALRDGLRSDQAAFGIIAAVLAEVARAEADNAATRVRSAIAANKRTGRYTGGVVPFGYRPDANPDGPGRILVPHGPEAAIVREIAERIVGGESVNSIVLDLNARRVPTTRSAARSAAREGKPTDGLDVGTWNVGILQGVITSDTLLGRVTAKGQLVTGEDGLPVTAFEPVLDYATMARVRSHTRNPRDPKTNPRPYRRRAARLLSGVAFCGRCGWKMYVRVADGNPVYRCANTRPGECSTPRMHAAHAERAVEERFLRIVGAHPELKIVEEVESPESAAELAEVEAAIAKTSSELADDDADIPNLLARLSSLKARRATLRAIPAKVTRTARPTGRTYAEAWAAGDDEARRALLLSAVEDVRIDPLPEGASSKGYHPARVRITWDEVDDHLAAA